MNKNCSVTNIFTPNKLVGDSRTHKEKRFQQRLFAMEARKLNAKISALLWMGRCNTIITMHC